MKLYHKSELKHSRIFFDKRPPKFMAFLIFLTGLCLMGAGFIAYYLPKNYIVKANGTSVVTGTEYLSVKTGASVITLHKQEGEEVKAGDLILSMSGGQEGLQGEALTKQLDILKAKEAIFQKFEQSLNDKKNYLTNAGEEQEYYGKVEYYLSQLTSEHYADGTQYAKLQDEYAKQAKLQNEKAQLQADLQVHQNQLALLESELATLNAQTPASMPPSGTSGETLTPPVSDTSARINQLNTAISEIKVKIESTTASITSKDSEIESLTSSIKDLERNYGDPTSQAYNTYAQLISELGTARSNLKKSITELEANLGIATGQDKSFTVTASTDGILHYTVPLKPGMAVQQGQTLAEVASDKAKTYVEAYVLATDISRVKKGASVDVAISGVNSQKYGTIKGKVSQIDSGTTMQETREGNVAFYKVQVALEKHMLTYEKEQIRLEKSMPVEVRIVYDKETYMDWLLELLQFKQ